MISLGVLGLLLLPTRARAAEGRGPTDPCLSDTQCRASYDEALAMYEEGRLPETLAKFKAAYNRRQVPWLLINMGRTLHRLGRPRDSLEHYQLYQQSGARPDAEELRRLREYIDQSCALLHMTPHSSHPLCPKAMQAPVTPPPPVTLPPPPANTTPPPDPGQTSAVPPPKDPVAAPLAATASGPTESKPIYKKWWFWTLIGVGVAGGVVGLAVGLSPKGGPALPAGAPEYRPVF